MKKKPDKKIIIPIVFLLLTGAVLIVNYVSGSRVTGEMEAVIVPEPAKVSGEILEMKAELGQQVKEGDVLAVIDSHKYEYAIEQLEMNLEQAILKSESSVTSEGSSLLSAQSAYKTASITFSQSLDNYENLKELYEAGAVPKSDLNKAELTLSNAEKGLDSARAALNTANSIFAEENSEISVRMIQNQLAEAVDDLENCVIKAPCSGTVITKSYNEGSLVNAGYTLFEIAKEDEGFLTAYIPEDRISGLEYGAVLQVKYNKTYYEGKVVYIDVKKQYSPKDLQTEATRAKKSFKIKLTLPEECKIKPGETADIKLP